MKHHSKFLEMQEFGIASKMEMDGHKTEGMCRGHTMESYI